MGQYIEHLVVSHGLITGATVGFPPILLLDPEQGEQGMPIPGPAGLQGIQGTTGSVGPAGTPGLNGAVGPPGPAIFLEAEPGEEPLLLGSGGGGMSGPASFGPQAAKTALMGPASGVPATATFRQPAAADLSDGVSGTGAVLLSSGPGMSRPFVGQGGNTFDALTVQRFTDTNPLGTLIRLIGIAGGTDLFVVDVTGTMTVGVIPAARVTGIPVFLPSDIDDEPIIPLTGRLLQAFVGAGAAHAQGDVPDPGATAYPNTQRVLRDNATFAVIKGQDIAYLFTGTDQSTTSTTMGDLATADSVTFTLDGTQDLLVEYVAFIYNNTASGGNSSQIELDTVAQLALTQTCGAASAVACQAMSFRLANVGAGSHTVRVRHATLTGQTAHWMNRSLKVSIIA